MKLTIDLEGHKTCMVFLEFCRGIWCALRCETETLRFIWTVCLYYFPCIFFSGQACPLKMAELCGRKHGHGRVLRRFRPVGIGPLLSVRNSRLNSVVATQTFLEFSPRTLGDSWSNLTDTHILQMGGSTINEHSFSLRISTEKNGSVILTTTYMYKSWDEPIFLQQNCCWDLWNVVTKAQMWAMNKNLVN